MSSKISRRGGANASSVGLIIPLRPEFLNAQPLEPHKRAPQPKIPTLTGRGRSNSKYPELLIAHVFWLLEKHGKPKTVAAMTGLPVQYVYDLSLGYTHIHLRPAHLPASAKLEWKTPELEAAAIEALEASIVHSEARVRSLKAQVESARHNVTVIALYEPGDLASDAEWMRQLATLLDACFTEDGYYERQDQYAKIAKRLARHLEQQCSAKK